MKVLDSGHDYLLDSLDGGEPIRLTFVKRNDPPGKYPGNEAAHPGTILQEAYRAIIERVLYLDNQAPHWVNPQLLKHARDSIFLLESRASEIRGTELGISGSDGIEMWPVCPSCGHISCFEHCPDCGGKLILDEETHFCHEWTGEGGKANVVDLTDRVSCLQCDRKGFHTHQLER